MPGAATLLGAAEALNAGVTTVFDYSNATRSPAHTDAILDAFDVSGDSALSSVTARSRRRPTCGGSRAAPAG